MKTLRLVSWLVFAAFWLFIAVVEGWRWRHKQEIGENGRRLALVFAEQLAVGATATATRNDVLSAGFFGSVVCPALLVVGIIVRTLSRRIRATS